MLTCSLACCAMTVGGAVTAQAEISSALQMPAMRPLPSRNSADARPTSRPPISEVQG
ncbi:MAG: hypothetical protein AB9M53_00260 [Leptothrix sp. (in: b-proteobacteria)]